MFLIKFVKHCIQKEQFQPGFLGLFVNPFYFARKGLYLQLRSLAQSVKGKTLDAGCGQKPYEHLFEVKEYIGLEIDTPENRLNKKADYFYDGITFPFEDNTFDSVISNQVFEHVFNPDIFLSEIHRVLNTNGIFLLTVPFVWDEHEQPIDYARYSSFGLKYLLEQHGFEILDQRKSVADIRVIFQLIAGYIYKITITQSKVLNLLIAIFLISPFNVMGELLALLLPENNDLYLDNIVLVKKI